MRASLLTLLALSGLLSSTARITAQDEPQPPTKMGSAGSSGGSIGEMAEAPPPAENSAAAPAAPTTQSATPPARPAPRADSIDDESIPAYHIAEVLVEGDVHPERADLKVTIDVEINRDGAWYDVPLRLGQAHIYSKSASGPGSQSPASPAVQDDGLHWRFRGAGTHRLEFSLGVPVRSEAAGRRLQLSLPMMPALFEARIKLRFANPKIVIRSNNRDATLSTQPGENGGTIVEGSIPGGRLDFVWQDRDQMPDPDWLATSTFTLRRASSAWELTCQQSIRRSETGRTNLVVRLPLGFTLDEVVGPHVGKATAVADRPGWVTIPVNDDAPERIDLRWTLRAPFPVSGGILDLVGFDIDGVREHVGQVRVSHVPGYQVLPLEDALQFLERIDDTAPPPDGRPAALVYAFSAPRWRLSLNAKQIEPIFSCAPQFDLTVLDRIARLTARFAIHEQAGDVRNVRVDISGLESEGWVMLPRTGVGIGSAAVSRSPGVVQFEFPPDVAPPKTAELQFERQIQGTEFRFAVPLPQLSATVLQPAEVTVRAADALQVDVTAAGELTDLSRPATTPASGDRIVKVVRMPASVALLKVAGSIQPRTVSADSTIVVQDLESGRVTIDQTIQFRVEYGRLDSVRLRVPDQIPLAAGAERFAFRIRIDGRDIAETEWNSGVLRVPLTEPLIGRFAVSVAYALPRSETATSLTLPVVTTPDADYTDVTFEASPSLGIAVPAGSTDWKAVPTAPDRLKWAAPGTVREVPLAITASTGQSVQRMTIPSALIETHVEPDGLQRTTARYRISRGGMAIGFRLPPGVNPPKVHVEGRAVNDLRPTSGPSGEEWVVRLPLAASGSAVLLEIEYDTQPARESGSLVRLTVDLPEFSSGVHVENLLWMLSLPENELVLASPAGMTRLFDWQREGIFWKRQPSPRLAAAVQELGFSRDLADAAAGRRMIYGYRQIGARPKVRLWAIDRSLVVLVGAGITLIIGFLFWSFPRLRNVVTLLSLTFVLCLLGLWLEEPIKIFLQPALIGAALATIATAIDGRARRRTMRPSRAESSIRPVPRPTTTGPVNDPIRSTILRPAGSDHGVPG